MIGICASILSGLLVLVGFGSASIGLAKPRQLYVKVERAISSFLGRLVGSQGNPGACRPNISHTFVECQAFH